MFYDSEGSRVRQYVLYNSTVFASKLESKWAYFFTYYQIPFTYDPIDPVVDFTLENLKIQVKSGGTQDQLTEKDRKKYQNVVLIFGQPIFNDFSIQVNDRRYGFQLLQGKIQLDPLVDQNYMEKLWRVMLKAYNNDVHVQVLQVPDMKEEKSKYFLWYCRQYPEYTQFLKTFF